MATSHDSLPLWMKIIAGGVAGSTETIVTMPLDVLKTRSQISTEKMSMFQTGRLILQNEGIPAFYRGSLSPVVGEFLKRGVKFGCNEHYKKIFTTKDGKVTNWGSAGAGALAGITEAFVNCPFEVVKVRMQAKENKGVYKSTFDAAQKILANEGIFRGLYQGIEAQLWRNTVWNSVYFGCIGSIKNMILPTNADKKTTMLTSMLAGFIGGTLASCCNISFDMAKSRIQNQLPGSVHKYKWAIPTLITVYKEEGARALFKGLGPKVARLSVGGALMSLIFDLTIEEFAKRYHKAPQHINNHKV